MEWVRGEYTINDDKLAIDQAYVYDQLSQTYWASNRTKETVLASFRHSLCFNLMHGRKQIGFARVLTDTTVLAWICDLFVAEEYRGQGLGKWLVASILEHPDVKNTMSQRLATKDAHGLYEQFGFEISESMKRVK
jgi:GNAT superfamily N-acetyltransferase